MLQRSSQVGEFYRMSPPAVFDATEAVRGPAPLDTNANVKAATEQIAKKNLPTTYMGALRMVCRVLSHVRSLMCASALRRHHDLRRGVRPPRAHSV